MNADKRRCKMRNNLLRMVIAAALLLSAASLAQAADKLYNVNFESGDISGWNTWAVTTDVSETVNHTPEGTYSANPSLNDVNGPFNMGGLIQEIEGIAGGDKVEVSGWIKTKGFACPAGGEIYAFIKLEFFGYGQMIETQESDKLTGTSDWTKVNISTIAPSGADMVKVILMLWNVNNYGSQGDVYFDDISLNISR